MISENRLDEIALLPSRRENIESNDVEANYLVGRDMAGAIHQLLEDRAEILLQNDELLKWVKSQAASHHKIAVEYAQTDEDRLTTHNAMAHAYTAMAKEMEKRSTEKRKCAVKSAGSWICQREEGHAGMHEATIPQQSPYRWYSQ